MRPHANASLGKFIMKAVQAVLEPGPLYGKLEIPKTKLEQLLVGQRRPGKFFARHDVAEFGGRSQRGSPANACCSALMRSRAAVGRGPCSAAASASSNCCGVAMPTRMVPIAECDSAKRVAASVRFLAKPSLTSDVRRRARARSAS